MAESIFGNPLVLMQTTVGSLLEQRAVVLYQQTDDYPPTVQDIEANKDAMRDGDSGKLSTEYWEEITRANANEIVGYLVQKNKLKELFTGIEVPYLDRLNGFNVLGVSYLDGKVEISSDIAEHPLEDGTKITDTSIRNPITAEVRIVMPRMLYTRVYQQIYEYYTRKQKIMLKTKFGMIKNLVIAAMPYELKPEEIDRPVITLSLREIIEVGTEFVMSEFSGRMTAEAADVDTENTGRTMADAVQNRLVEEAGTPGGASIETVGGGV